MTKPVLLLHAEGALLLLLSLLIYHSLGASWLLFALLFLAPDLSILGYLAGVRAGAATYNAVHTLAAPLLLASAGILSGTPSLLPLSAIWAAHIGMDRALGFGLKYPTFFRDTHLQRVSRS